MKLDKGASVGRKYEAADARSDRGGGNKYRS